MTGKDNKPDEVFAEAGVPLHRDSPSAVQPHPEMNPESSIVAQPHLPGSSDSAAALAMNIKAWWMRGVFLILLLICGVLVYRPAMGRFFASDQLMYFVELDGETSLSSGLRLLDYTVVRRFAKGDDALYRPLTFVWLAAGNALFGRDFRAWNAANLAIHLLVAYVLFEVLRRQQRTWFASAFALLFAVLVANFELVTWSHLGGYMLGYGLLLLALLAAREMAQGKRDNQWRWAWMYGVTLLGAMMFHEIAVITSLLVIPYVYFSLYRKPGVRWRGPAMALLAPILIYFSLYAIHALRCERLWWMDPQQGLTPSLFPSRVGQTLWVWIIETLLPGFYNYSSTPFSKSSPVREADWKFLVATVSAAGALWIGLILCFRRGFTRRRLLEAWPFAALLATIMLAYTGMNCLGRAYASLVVYYTYFFALFSAVLLYTLIDFTQLGRRARGWALILLFGLGVANGWQTYKTGCKIEKINAPVANYYEKLHAAVRPYLQDPGFSFVVKDVPPQINPISALAIGYPDQPNRKNMSVSQAIYGKRYDPFHPKIVLTIFGGPPSSH